MTPTAEAYNDGSIQYGAPGLVQIFSKAGVLKGIYMVEDFTPSDPTKTIERSDQVGGPYGFVDINAQKTSSAVVQLGTVAALWPANGDYFIIQSDPAQGNEKWTLGNRSTPMQQNGYWKSTFACKKTTFS